MSINKLLIRALILLFFTVLVFSYCVHLKLCHFDGENIHETKGVFPEEPLFFNSNFAQPIISDTITQESDNDASKDYVKKSLK